MIRITQGDTPTLQLTAQDGAGNAIDLTGASFTSYIKQDDGTDLTIANAAHSIVSAAAGTFTIALTAVNTAALKAGGGARDLVTKITIGGNITHYHAKGILTVLPPSPEN